MTRRKDRRTAPSDVTRVRIGNLARVCPGLGNTGVPFITVRARRPEMLGTFGDITVEADTTANRSIRGRRRLA